MTNKKEYQMLLVEAEKVLTDSTNVVIADRIALRDAVCTYFDVERANGASLKSVLQTVEEILRRAEIRVTGRGDRLDGHRELARQIIDWCVQLDRTGRLRSI